LIQAVKQLGKKIRELYPEKYANIVDVFIADVTTDALLIVLEKRGDNFRYNKVVWMEPRQDIFPKLLYKDFGRNIKIRPAPIAKVEYLKSKSKDKKASEKHEEHKKKIKKEIEASIISWFTQEIDKRRIESEERIFLENIKKGILSSLDNIVTNIKEQMYFSSQEKKKNKKCIVTLQFLENGKELYLRDFDIFSRVFLDRNLDRYANKWGITSKGENSICSLCHEKKEEVFGCASDIFSWYTLDKRGFAPFFDKSLGWKLFPVCKECIIDLEIGKKFVLHNLSLKFNDYSEFFLIPKLLNPKIINKSVLKKFEYFKDISKDHTIENIKGLEDYKIQENKLKQATTSTIEMIGNYEKDNGLTNNMIFLNLIFIKDDGRSIKIFRSIEDILPSRFVKITDEIYQINEDEMLDKHKMYLQLVLNILYSEKEKESEEKKTKNKEKKSKSGSSIEKKYLSTIDSLLKDITLNYSTIIKDIALSCQEIVKESYLFDEDKKKIAKKIIEIDKGKNNVMTSANAYELIINAYFKYLVLLKKLNLIQKRRVLKMNDRIEINEKISEDKKRIEILNSIFSTYSEFFDQPIIRAVFILGVLTKLLMDIQYVNLESTPFFNRLNGLKLNKRIIIKLVSEVKGKLSEYSAFYTDLEEEMTEYFLETGHDWLVSDYELSFFFVLGMNNARKFKSESKKGDENNE